jgi:hypothetical protein
MVIGSWVAWFFERVMNGFCGSRLAARLCQKENISFSKKLVIEPLRQSYGLLRQSSLPYHWLPDASLA